MVPLSWPTVKDEEINFFDAAPADIKHLNAGIPKAVRQSSAKRWTAQPHIIADRDLSGLQKNDIRQVSFDKPDHRSAHQVFAREYHAL